ncbi:MAG: hypothetical protein CL583_00465 [Alteromonadaceae bacterium]|uniref:Uncharacterized protein n=1 Tax=Hydrocarboniclastica marina TaxID=2259620 RepID=A0A4P7XI38_9ALTE|nr:hypothetical protein [Alteromonadaceae bacterium]QCF26164.1 hypothetical protein soil367_09600 [Hydrocarboniclastica marina]
MPSRSCPIAQRRQVRLFLLEQGILADDVRDEHAKAKIVLPRQAQSLTAVSVVRRLRDCTQ